MGVQPREPPTQVPLEPQVYEFTPVTCVIVWWGKKWELISSYTNIKWKGQKQLKEMFKKKLWGHTSYPAEQEALQMSLNT